MSADGVKVAEETVPEAEQLRVIKYRILQVKNQPVAELFFFIHPCLQSIFLLYNAFQSITAYNKM